MNHIFGNEAITCIEVAANGYCACIKGDHVLIFNNQMYGDWELKEIYEEDVRLVENGEDTDELVFYDLTDGNPYYWSHHDECIIRAINQQLMNVHYIRVSSWNRDGSFFSDELKCFEHQVDTMSGEYLLDKNGTVFFVKETLLDYKTGEVTGFVCYTWKYRK